MEHFSYSLLLSLMHSLWQAALLVCLYLGADLLIKRSNPVYKRNLLFILLATQFIVTTATFIIYYSGASFFINEFIASNLAGLFIRQNYIEIIAPWLTGAYVFMLLLKATQLIINWQQFRFNSRTGWIKPSIDFKLFTTVKANEFGIRRKVSLWYSNAVHTPLTFGFLKPVILLPVALVNNLSVKETETLIIHELTHIKSNDYFFNWLLIVCETLFFFNPFIKIISNRIKLEREKNCDTSVLQFNYQALNYAETLLKTARFKATATPFFLAAVFKNAQLVKRIQFFTQEKNLCFYKRNYSSLAVVPVIALLLFNIFLVNYIKHRNIVEVAVPEAVAFLGGNYNENITDGFSTDVIPVSKADYRVAEENNVADLKEKVEQQHLQALDLQKQAEELQYKIAQENISIGMPVAMEQSDNSKEITLKEENSATGISVTKVYQMKFENGKWTTTLLWTITEKRMVSDSLPYLRDTTTKFNNQLQAQ